MGLNSCTLKVSDLAGCFPTPHQEYSLTLTKMPLIDKRVVKRVIFNPPATIIIWADDTKTVVKCIEGDEFDPYYGFCSAVVKKLFGATCTAKKIAGLK